MESNWHISGKYDSIIYSVINDICLYLLSMFLISYYIINTRKTCVAFLWLLNIGCFMITNENSTFLIQRTHKKRVVREREKEKAECKIWAKVFLKASWPIAVKLLTIILILFLKQSGCIRIDMWFSLHLC